MIERKLDMDASTAGEAIGEAVLEDCALGSRSRPDICSRCRADLVSRCMACVPCVHSATGIPAPVAHRPERST